MANAIWLNEDGQVYQTRESDNKLYRGSVEVTISQDESKIEPRYEEYYIFIDDSTEEFLYKIGTRESERYCAIPKKNHPIRADVVDGTATVMRIEEEGGNGKVHTPENSHLVCEQLLRNPRVKLVRKIKVFASLKDIAKSLCPGNCREGAVCKCDDC